MLGTAQRCGLAVLTRQLGRVEYLPIWEAMQAFTRARAESVDADQNSREICFHPNPGGRDQLWICEHFPVFTQGLAGRADHVISPGDIPVVQTDRGGQVTYHGPGQVVAYPLIDLKRAGYYVKEYVYRIEEAVIRTLMHFGVTGHRVSGAPGIYVRLGDPFSHARLAAVSDGQAGRERFNGLGKIAALGIKVSRHCTYHGVALNASMDLEPFTRIDPCGYAGLQTTDLRSLGVALTWDEVAEVLAQKLTVQLAG